MFKIRTADWKVERKSERTSLPVGHDSQSVSPFVSQTARKSVSQTVSPSVRKSVKCRIAPAPGRTTTITIFLSPFGSTFLTPTLTVGLKLID